MGQVAVAAERFKPSTMFTQVDGWRPRFKSSSGHIFMSRGVVKDVAVDHGLGMIDDQRMLVILTLFNTILWHYTADIF